MNMLIDAAKQALEALEYHQEQTRPIHKTQETIIALRQAIEQAEQWDTSDMAHRPNGLSVEQTLDGLAETSREIEQEPVAQCTNSDTWNCKYCRRTETCEALKDSRNFGEPAKRERPVKSYTGGEPQYATDAPKHEDDDIQEYKRPWVGLTDEEIDAIGYKYGAGGLELMDELTSKLKEKNGG